MADPLSNEAIEAALGELPGWEHEDDSILRHFKFKNFQQALAFIVRVGVVCEQENHHPELWNTYNQVTLRFTTHDSGSKVTALDTKVAGKINKFAPKP